MGEEIDESSEEEDFMSDSFLAGAEKERTSSSREGAQTYSEKRRKELNAARDRGKTQNRAEREKEARKMGLSRNLLKEIKEETSGKRKKMEEEEEEEEEEEDNEVQPIPSNKALKMMLAMGYKHGQGLGKDESAVASVEEPGRETEDGERDGTSKRLVEPLSIDERWMGAKARAGIGKLSTFSAQALSRDISEATSREATESAKVNEEGQFRQRSREVHNIRHWEKLLVDARSTCEDLDTKLGVQFSPLWLNPESLSKKADQLPEHVASLVEYAFLGFNTKKDTSNAAKGEEEEEDKEVIARAQESKQFCLLPSKARLEITLSHLRRAHCYCLFCGHKYTDQDEIHSQCPGEEEDDH